MREGDGPDNDWFDRARSGLTALIVRAGDGPDNDWFDRVASSLTALIVIDSIQCDLSAFLES